MEFTAVFSSRSLVSRCDLQKHQPASSSSTISMIYYLDCPQIFSALLYFPLCLLHINCWKFLSFSSLIILLIFFVFTSFLISKLFPLFFVAPLWNIFSFYFKDINIVVNFHFPTEIYFFQVDFFLSPFKGLSQISDDSWLPTQITVKKLQAYFIHQYAHHLDYDLVSDS